MTDKTEKTTTAKATTYNFEDAANLLGINPVTLKVIMTRDGFPEGSVENGFDKAKLDKYIASK